MRGATERLASKRSDLGTFRKENLRRAWHAAGGQHLLPQIGHLGAGHKGPEQRGVLLYLDAQLYPHGIRVLLHDLR